MSIANLLRRQLVACFDLLLPPVCHFCGRPELPAPDAYALCVPCHASIQPLVSSCLRCSKPLQSFTSASHTCAECLRQPPPFTRVYSVGHHTGPLKTAIHRLKYRDRLSLARILGTLLAERLLTEDPEFRCDLVVPVPLHPARLRRRGYNQALELARPIAKQLGAPLHRHRLSRHRVTAPQQGLGLIERNANLRHAFRFDGCLDAQTVLLVDDVMTSGATVRECSRVLVAAGAAEVRVAVIARA